MATHDTAAYILPLADDLTTHATIITDSGNNASNARTGIRDVRWVQDQQSFLQSNFGGLWVAVLDERVVGSATTLPSAYEAAMAIGAKDALLIYVDPDGEKWDDLIA